MGSRRGHVNAAQTAEVKRRLLLVSRTSVLRWDGSSDLQHANLHRNGGHHPKISKICRHLGVFGKCPLRCYCRSIYIYRSGPRCSSLHTCDFSENRPSFQSDCNLQPQGIGPVAELLPQGRNLRPESTGLAMRRRSAVKLSEFRP